MKKILTVYTGGTICSTFDGEKRGLDTKSTKRVLVENFKNSGSKYASLADELLVDSCLTAAEQTLSENMTLNKLTAIYKHIKSFDLGKYAGVVVLHGTDTLAYTAALFSFLFYDTPVPIMPVSGNRPPLDEKSNANVNFRIAVELIMDDIAPNIYVPYRNSDNIIQLHLGSTIMQCPNRSEDFRGASSEKSFIVGVDGADNRRMYDKCAEYSQKRADKIMIDTRDINIIDDSVLLIIPYTGLDYSRILLEGVKAVVHGTYHSGTVCVERGCEKGAYGTRSVLYLADECKKRGIPLFVAPTVLDSDQYSSVYDLAKSTDAVLLNMTTEAAYAKAITAISGGISKREIIKLMTSEINNEYL